MDFTFSEEQLAFRDSIKRYLSYKIKLRLY